MYLNINLFPVILKRKYVLICMDIIKLYLCRIIFEFEFVRNLL